MSLIGLLVAVILIALVLWLVGQLPLDAKLLSIIRVIVIVLAIIWILEQLHFFAGPVWYYR